MAQNLATMSTTLKIVTSFLREVHTPGMTAEGARRDLISALQRVADVSPIRARTIDDIVRQATPYLRDTIEYDPDAVAKQWKDRDATKTLLSATRDRLSAAADWSPAPLEEELRKLAETLGTTGGKIFQPLRVALTGLTVSPGIFDVLEMLGRERSLARIEAAIRQL